MFWLCSHSDSQQNGRELLHSALPLHIQHSISLIYCQISVACFTRLLKKNQKIKLTGITELGMWVRSQNTLNTVCRNISSLSRGWCDLKLFFGIEIIVSVVGKLKRLSSCFSGHFTVPAQVRDMIWLLSGQRMEQSSPLWLWEVAWGFQILVRPILGTLIRLPFFLLLTQNVPIEWYKYMVLLQWKGYSSSS